MCVDKELGDKSYIKSIQYFKNTDQSRTLTTCVVSKVSKGFIKLKNGKIEYVFSGKNDDVCKHGWKCPSKFIPSKLVSKSQGTFEDFFKDKTIYKINYTEVNNPVPFPTLEWYAPVDKSLKFGKRRHSISKFVLDIKYLRSI